MSMFDHITVIDPQRAIAGRDLPALRDCLAKGWGKTDLNLGWVQDMVANGWTEGWIELVDRFPDLRAKPALIWVAFQQVQLGIMEDLLKAGLDPHAPIYHPVLTESGPVAPICALVEGIPRDINLIGESRSDALTLEKRLLSLCDLIHTYGMDPYLPHPELFVEQDVGFGGHSVWTRALRFRRWEVAQKLLPTDWDQVKRQPRAHEALHALEKSIHPRQMDMPTGEYPSASIALVQRDRHRAWPMWSAALVQWGDQWLPPNQRDWAILNDERDWKDILESSPTLRAYYWHAWETPREDGWTTWHALVMEADQPLAQAVLRQVVQDGYVPLGWNEAIMDGLTPAQLFAAVWGGGEAPATMKIALTALPPLAG